MRMHCVITVTLGVLISAASPLSGQKSNGNSNGGNGHSVQLGPRPYFLVQDMEDSALKQQLLSCFGDPMKKTDFSIGHRGAALQFPEHTKESYEAAARMGAGIVECD